MYGRLGAHETRLSFPKQFSNCVTFICWFTGLNRNLWENAAVKKYYFVPNYSNCCCAASCLVEFIAVSIGHTGPPMVDL